MTPASHVTNTWAARRRGSFRQSRMGVCNSKNKKPEPLSSDQAQQQQQAEQKQASLNETVVAAAGTPAAAVDEPSSIVKAADPEVTADPEVAAGDAASAEPANPQPAAGGADADVETPAHTYNSAEKPFRSAMRTSDTNKSEYSRRSSSGMSNVGFSVNVDAPESEGHKSYSGANSISLKKILDIFYDKVVAHEQIGHYFNGIDMMKLKRHQLRFMGLAFGGKELVNEEDPNLNLRRIHYHLIRDKGLSLEHWEVFVGLFDETLEQLEKEIPLETRETAKRSVHATKHYFVPIGEENEYTHTNIAAMPVPEEGEEAKCPFAGTEAAEENEELQKRQLNMLS
ncbi:hypothetical protein OEZ86_013620 [Tetradesmus obliquus]|nr:hypothetical protein OEZ86_013620 [Tetradesmus obliquus]